jgi:hypothetical protein
VGQLERRSGNGEGRSGIEKGGQWGNLKEEVGLGKEGRSGILEEEKRLANVWKICQRTYVHNFVYIYMRGFFSHLYNVCTVQMYRMYNVHMYSMLRGDKILYAVQSPLCICTEILIRNSEKQKYFTRREICIPGHPRPTRPNQKYYSRT